MQRPPTRIEISESLLLRVHELDDAEAIAAAVARSLSELRPWMPWATPEAGDPAHQRARLAELVPTWDTTSDFGYVIVEHREIIGCVGLDDRIGGDGLEIGYWVRTDRAGQGIATRCVAALTEAALALESVRRVEIHCDEANTRSAVIPKRLGYRLDRIERTEVTAPGETGRSMIWVHPPTA